MYLRTKQVGLYLEEKQGAKCDVVKRFDCVYILAKGLVFPPFTLQSLVTSLVCNVELRTTSQHVPMKACGIQNVKIEYMYSLGLQDVYVRTCV